MLNDFSWIIRSSFQFSPAWSQHVWLPFLPFLRLEQAFNISNFNKYNKAFKQWWIQHRQVIFYRKMAAHRKKEDKILLRTIHKFHSLIKTFNIPWYLFLVCFLQLYQSLVVVGFATFTHQIWQKGYPESCLKTNAAKHKLPRWYSVERAEENEYNVVSCRSAVDDCTLQI